MSSALLPQNEPLKARHDRAAISQRSGPLTRPGGEPNPAFVLVMLICYTVIFWASWVVLLGPLTFSTFYGALGAFLLLLRVGWPLCNRMMAGVISRPSTATVSSGQFIGR